MSFTIVKVRGYSVGGLVVPGIEPGSGRLGDDLLDFTLERLRARGVGDVTVVYVSNPEVGWTALAGYRCDDVASLAVGDSMIRITDKYAARFTPDGSRTDPWEDVWTQVEIAEKDGEIARAYREEVAFLPASGEMELFVSLE
ncbi:hypothetical protein ACIBED_15275 [Rhodococcus coprophilus]|uniref:AraC family transcriptional regulator n=1 Tax=Rhodococcus coprophilus TaxID=38310 RepID=A0A2X4UC49_9NOCA|nr:hypothetical protein [Rhodococcus coprophilus]MBM7457827.1 hypothetical protein [Rhodococcus coprophilus]SQI30450.1 AraC family transcriptional regulator [Rhodococcus coprophilus]